MVCLIVILKSPVIGFSVCVLWAKEIAVIEAITKRIDINKISLSFINDSPDNFRTVRGMRGSYQKPGSYSRCVWRERDLSRSCGRVSSKPKATHVAVDACCSRDPGQRRCAVAR